MNQTNSPKYGLLPDEIMKRYLSSEEIWIEFNLIE